jgi:predicted Zn-dependent peptidase
MINTITLDNGIRVVYEKMDHLQTVAFGVFVKTGSIDESPELYGASHFIEHMMFKGTDKHSAKEIADAFDGLGGTVNAYTSRDHTCYYFKSTSETFLPAAEILCEMLTKSLFDEKEIEKERQVILEEIKMIDDQPDELAMENCSRLVFKGDLLEHDVAGNPQALAGQTGSKLKEFIKKEYTCDSIVVAVAGNFNHEEVVELVEKRLTSFGKNKSKTIDALAEYTPGSITICKDIEQTNLCIGTRFVTLGSDEYFAAAFFNNILGGSMSSRLFQNIREEKGLAYTIVSLPNIMARSGMLLIYAGIAHNKISECLDAVHHELEIIGTQGIGNEELEKAKNQGKSSVVFSMERTQSRMMSIGRNLLLLNKVYEQEEVLDLMNQVTLEDVNQLAHKVTKSMPFSYAAVTPESIDYEKLVRNR